MGGLKYFLGIWLGMIFLTGCTSVSTWTLYSEMVTFFNLLVWLFLLSLPILVVVKLSSNGYTAENKKQTLISAWAGIFAGFALFIIYMVWFPGKVLSNNNHQNDLAKAKISTDGVPPALPVEFIVPTIIGVIIGFISLFALRKLASCWRLAGFFNLIVVAGVLIITVHFMGANDQPAVPAIIPGIGLGVLIHIICIPDTITKFFG
jgi:hypothetical protein